MTVALQTSQEEQSTFTNGQDVAGANGQNFNHGLDSQATLIGREEDDSSDSSMSSNIPVGHEQYAEELEEAGIFRDAETVKQPINIFELDQHLKQGPVDSNPAALDQWIKSINTVANRSEMLNAIEEQLLKETTQKKVVNTRWSRQHQFSEQLGQPKPDLTFGLAFAPLKRQFPRVCNLHGKYISYVRPLPDTALPVVCIEVKGPSGLMWHAINQNRHNCACGIKNIVEIKRAAGLAPETYVERILSVSIEMSTESVQVRSHWVTVTSDGRDQYWNMTAQMPLIIHDHPAIKQSITNVLKWGQKLQEELVEDLARLELQLEKQAQAEAEVESRKRVRSQSPSEADGEKAVTQAVKVPKKKKRAR